MSVLVANRGSLALACTLALTACQPEPADLCWMLASRCGGAHADNWRQWCRSECVTEYARNVACEANDECILCDAPREDGNTIYFGLPSDELEYLFTLTDPPEEPVHPPSEPAPTGSAFVDGPEFSTAGGDHGWVAYEPFGALRMDDPIGFCEPGPNHYIARNVLASDDEIVLRAERMESTSSPPYCPDGRCLSGPYSACDAPPSGCQYREEMETVGLGEASQADRTAADATPTYGYGRYRTVLRAAGDTVPVANGFVYAFFTQGNQACVDGSPNVDTNTSELDIEISSGEGAALTEPFCNTGEICVVVSTWVSSSQGIPDYQGIERHQVSGFRYRGAEIAGEYRTYGFDWQPRDVRFVYDADPDDCDESSGECAPDRGSLAICRHTRFIPRRPSPLHFQVWNAWWAGEAQPGSVAEMHVRRVWHEPNATDE